jgi:NH3-dependent NAD+ synthetase
MGLSKQQIYELAESVYWNVIEHLEIEHECIEDLDDGEGTQNTEKGTQLYYAIEDNLMERHNGED